MCETTLTCYSQVIFAGYELNGVQWFVFMVVLAFLLQVSANFLWLKGMQLSREILRSAPGSKERRQLIPKRLLFDFVSTVNWILRITLIIGTNIYIFLVIILGNFAGLAWTLRYQEEDIDSEKQTDPCKWSDEAILKIHKRIEKLKNKPNKDIHF